MMHNTQAFPQTAQTSHSIGQWKLFFIILVEGFATIALEILCIRQLLPLVGSSVVVTSLIIGIFLFFLALGYWQGGRVQHSYQQRLLRNFCYALVGFSVGISYIFVVNFFSFAYHWVTGHLLVILIAYLLVVLAPIVYFLGQTIPITTNLFQRELHIGAISGKALFLSTIGSFLGAVLTSTLLMNYLGVAWTIFICCCLVALLCGFVMDRTQKNNTLVMTAIAILLLIGFELNVGVERNNFIHTNNFANYQVRLNISNPTTDWRKTLIINNGLSATLTPGDKGFPYVELIKRILFQDMGLTGKQILVLGAGGFTISAEKTAGNDFTYVDIDKDIKQVVEENFQPHINGEFIGQDARILAKYSNNRYDVIISDMYNHPNSIPTYLLTREHFSNIRHLLNPNGLAIFNVIARPYLDDDYSKRIDNTIRYVFHNCMSIPSTYSNSLTNILYFCRPAANEGDRVVYNDNKNPATIDFFRVQNQQRNSQV
ncbi:MAG: hypothetical protein Tsb005_00810 [Gammaproteobacteria bacterium]